MDTACMIDLSLDIESHSDWSITKALTELIANAIDATLENNQKLKNITQDYNICDINSVDINDSFVYDEVKKIFLIKDKGCGMDIKNIGIQGNTTKKESKIAIGGYGEGFRGAISTLLRNKCDVFIHTNNTKIVFKINDSGKIFLLYNENLLSEEYNIKSTVIEIHSISKKDIENAKKEFVYFNNKQKLLYRTDWYEIYLPYNIKNQPIEFGGFYYRASKTQVGKTQYKMKFIYNITQNQKIDSIIRHNANFNRMIDTTSVLDVVKKIHFDCKSIEIYHIVKKELSNAKCVYKDIKSKKIKEYYESLNRDSLLNFKHHEFSIKYIDVLYKNIDISECINIDFIFSESKRKPREVVITKKKYYPNKITEELFIKLQELGFDINYNYET